MSSLSHLVRRRLQTPLGAVAFAALLAAAAPVAPAAEHAPASGVAWMEAASDADIAKAFAEARTQAKPVLLYWGAVWCPPCNQLQAMLFKRQDFAERSHSFVAVHLDGDTPGAQKLASRFKVVGYPTLILFNPEGKELTRLPGESDAPQVLQVLDLGLASGRPVAAVLADARAGRPISGAEWRLLAFYSWDTDASALLPEAERAATLRQLAAACPAGEGEASTRLLLKALSEQAGDQAAPADAAARERVLAVLADPVRSRSFTDVLTNQSAKLVAALAPQPGPERTKLVAAADTALARLQADETLSRADRLTALDARVGLARIDQKPDEVHPKLPAALVKQAREAAAAADRETTNGFERQSVIPEAGDLLADAGLWAESDALLKSGLAKSHAPYYFMSALAVNARHQGHDATALDWYRQAWDRSEGPATRLRWGSSYLGALVDLAPQDDKRIEATANGVLAEAAAQRDMFYERNAMRLKLLGSKLAKWNAGGRHQAVMDRLNVQVESLCAKLPANDPQRPACDGLLKTAQPAA